MRGDVGSYGSLSKVSPIPVKYLENTRSRGDGGVLNSVIGKLFAGKVV